LRLPGRKGLTLLSTINSTLIVLVLLAFANQLASAVRSQEQDRVARERVARTVQATTARPGPMRSIEEIERLSRDAYAFHFNAIEDFASADRNKEFDPPFDPWGREIALLAGDGAGVGLAPGGKPFAVSAGPDRKFSTTADNLYSYDSDLTQSPAPESPASAPSTTGQAEP